MADSSAHGQPPDVRKRRSDRLLAISGEADALARSARRLEEVTESQRLKAQTNGRSTQPPAAPPSEARPTRRFERPPGTVSEKKFRETQSFARSMQVQASLAAGDMAFLQKELDYARRAKRRLQGVIGYWILASAALLIACSLIIWHLAKAEPAATNAYRITAVRYVAAKQALVGTAVPDPSGQPLPRQEDISYAWSRTDRVSVPTVTKYGWENGAFVIYLKVPPDHRISRDWYVNDVDRTGR